MKYFILLSIVVTAQAYVKEVAKVGNKAYFIGADITRDSEYKMSWEDAVTFCIRESMNLATIKSPAQQSAVSKWHKTFGPAVYLGASDKSSEGTYYWQHNKIPIKYSNWGPNQPEKGAYSSCTSMSSSDGKWRSSYCDAAYGIPLCEKVTSG